MRWYVLQVMSGKEIQVVDQLRLLGIHALAPIEDRIIRQKGSWITKAYVLFSSYVFVECDFDADTWFKVNSLSSVIWKQNGSVCWERAENIYSHQR